MTGVFPLVLKTAKVVPVSKDLKSEYRNYCPVSLLPNTKKIASSITMILSKTYSLYSGNNILHLMS